jgi:glucose-1-phosphate cytidylyltransferase
MKVVFLAGGRGTRLAEETEVRPKPMVEIGEHPILWHLMKHYAHFGFKEFVVALGYKGEAIRRYFADGARAEDWELHLVDTGLETQTGGRVRRLGALLRDGTFMVTYGDGVSDVDLRALLRFHRAQGRMATVTAVRPPARFGGLRLDGDRAVEFIEKPQIGEGWINGGFMVFEPALLDEISGDETVLEADVLSRLAARGQLSAYRHERFWQCMDTLREKRLLQSLWQQGRAPWKLWS